MVARRQKKRKKNNPRYHSTTALATRIGSLKKIESALGWRVDTVQTGAC